MDRERLAMFGIACIDDREYLGEDVWGLSGMVEFLLEKKREGRLSSIFCSTHGTPDYISRLITCGCIDALMIAHNLLGFHLLSYFPKDKAMEDLTGNREIIFPLALRHRVSLLVMNPLAGGLVALSKAFPPHARFSRESHPATASEQLRTILRNPAVCSVVPGTASPDEARENAGAGREFEKYEPVSHTTLEDRVADPLSMTPPHRRCHLPYPLSGATVPPKASLPIGPPLFFSLFSMKKAMAWSSLSALKPHRTAFSMGVCRIIS
jgi:predicted aldo/keto reductase-like oxidoreductase